MDDAYHLFRRAIVERDEDAWSTIAECYRPLLMTWASRCSGAQFTKESFENLADEALARAWAALSPERFVSFPSIAALLGYLRTCVSATVTDAVRRAIAQDRLYLRTNHAPVGIVAEDILARLGREEFWDQVMRLTMSEAERTALRDRFVYDLPPRRILERHPALFRDITAVYGAIRNLCDRLRRHELLAQLCAEYLV